MEDVNLSTRSLKNIEDIMLWLRAYFFADRGLAIMSSTVLLTDWKCPLMFFLNKKQSDIILKKYHLKKNNALKETSKNSFGISLSFIIIPQ